MMPTRANHVRPAAGPRRSAQAGVSLLELLVSVLIFSFGMLGLAGLQTRTLSFNQSSLLRTQATALTDDVLDRMRADRANARVGRWDTAANVASTAMANTAFHERDLRDWKQQVELLLPSGQASVSTDLAPGATFGTVTVTILWDDTRGAKDSQRDADAITRLQTVSKL